HVAERRSRDLGHQDVSRADARELAFAVYNARPSGAPANARRMTAEPRMPQPDLVGHMRRLDLERPRLQQLEPVVLERPFDFDGRAEHILGLAQHAAEARRLAGIETRRACERSPDRLACGAAAVTTRLAMVFASRLDLPHETLPAEHDAIRHHLALRD